MILKNLKVKTTSPVIVVDKDEWRIKLLRSLRLRRWKSNKGKVNQQHESRLGGRANTGNGTKPHKLCCLFSFVLRFSHIRVLAGESVHSFRLFRASKHKKNNTAGSSPSQFISVEMFGYTWKVPIFFFFSPPSYTLGY